MATRENQSLQIAAVAFAILAVLLAVTTYIGFKQYSDQREENKNLSEQAAKAGRDLREAQDEANTYKEKMGFSIDDELPKIQDQIAADMKQYAANFPEEKQVYGAVLEYLHNEVKSISEREAAARDREQSLKQQLAKVQNDADKQVQEYVSQMREIEKDKKVETDKFEQDRGRFKQQTAQLDKNLQERRKEIADLKAAKEEQLSQLQDKVSKLEQQLFRVSREKQDLVKGSFETADGKVVRVNQGSETVWINLGRRDGLAERVMFSVYDAEEENNAATASKKAGVEVVRILGGNYAEARILSDTVSNPIVRGDLIYSPVWHRGRAESFALAGLIDIDGDGKSDLDLVRDLIRINGGIIDAQIGDDGEVSGKMTVNTRYLVKGEEPEVSVGTTQDPAAVAKALAALSEMNRDAENLGVENISVAEFLDRMGWRAADRTVLLGRAARPDDFRAEPPPGAQHGTTVAPAEKFRRRQPPQATF